MKKGPQRSQFLLATALAVGTLAAFAATEDGFYRIFGRSMVSNCASTIAGHESLNTMIPVCSAPFRKLPDGGLTYDLDRLTTPFDKSPTGDEPFLIEFLSRVSVYPGYFYEARFCHDKAAYETWKKAHPGFLGFVSDEIGNDAYMKWRCPDELQCRGNREVGSVPVSDKVWKEVISRKIPPTRERYVTEVLKPHFERVVEWNYGDRKMLIAGDGNDCLCHFYGYWGVGGLNLETTRTHFLYQIQEMFCRGAAHQFSIPWHWYIASFFGSYTTMAEQFPGCATYGPGLGISDSAIRRTTYLTWLSGSTSYWREAMDCTHFLHRTGNGALSDEGKMYDDFCTFIRGRDRGTPVIPIALLVPAARGYSRKGGKAFSPGYAYRHDDRMLDTVMSVILDFPRNRTDELRKKNIERVMANSRYGDVFDALTPDFPDQTSFRRTIGDYKAAVLIGDYGRNAEMEEILRDYVQKGGVLVLNSAQLDGAFDTVFTGVRVAGEKKSDDSMFATLVPTKARVLKTGKDGSVLFTSNAVGPGEVIVASERYLSQWFGDDKVAQDRALCDVEYQPIRHPDVEWLFDRLEEKTVPLKVNGFIQWGLNKTREGYLVYLVNNAGVEKEMDKAQKIAPGVERVEIDVRQIPHASARELLTGTNLGNGDFITWEVPNGDLSVIEIKAK